MTNYIKDVYIARRTVTKHVCPHCFFFFYVRASFYECPRCQKEVQTPVILEACRSLPAIVIDLMRALMRRMPKEQALVLASLHIPSLTPEGVRVIWEEIERPTNV